MGDEEAIARHGREMARNAVSAAKLFDPKLFALLPPPGWLNRIDEVLEYHGVSYGPGLRLSWALGNLVRSWQESSDGGAPGPEHWGPRASDTEQPVSVVDSELRDLIAVALSKHPALSDGWSDDPQSYLSQGVVSTILDTVDPALSAAYLSGHDAGYAAANVGDPWAGKKLAADSDLQHEIVRSLWDAADICLTDSQLTVMADAVIADVVAPVLAARDAEIDNLKQQLQDVSSDCDKVKEAIGPVLYLTQDYSVLRAGWMAKEAAQALSDARAELQRERESRQGWQEKLAEHEFKLNDAVGAEEGIDPYEAVVALHAEIDRQRAELDALKAEAVMLPRDWRFAIERQLTDQGYGKNGLPDIVADVQFGMIELIESWVGQPDTEATTKRQRSSYFAQPCDQCGTPTCEHWFTQGIPRTWREGDAEPTNVRRVRDRHGDIWTRNYGGSWESPDTMPCAWWYIAKKWAPLTQSILDGTQ